jgi:uncharacterized protein YaaQ
MKLLITVVDDQCIAPLTEQLVSKGYRATKLSSTGGFLRSGNTTLLLGVRSDQVDDVLTIIQSVCHTREEYVIPATHAEALAGFTPMPVKVLVGGAVVFVLNAEQWRLSHGMINHALEG